MASSKEVLFNPIVDNNPIALQVLGICSALAVTVSMAKPSARPSTMQLVMMSPTKTDRVLEMAKA